MHSNEGEQDAQETFEQRVAELRLKWDEVLRDLTAQRLVTRGETKQPTVDTNTLPHLLEQLTAPTGEPAARFLVLTAPSGVGKGTVGRHLEAGGIDKLPRVNTRPRRPQEVEGKDYRFVSEKEYEALAANGELFCLTSTEEESRASGSDQAERALHTQAAIPLHEFKERLAHGLPFYIDTGAGTARKIKNEPVVQGVEFATVFLLPPSFDALVERLNKRRLEEAVQGSDAMSDETALDRLAIAVNHLRDSSTTADGYVVNDAPERAAQQLKKFVRTET